MLSRFSTLATSTLVALVASVSGLGCPSPCFPTPASKPLEAKEPAFGWSVLIAGKAKEITVKQGVSFVDVDGFDTFSVAWRVQDTARGIAAVQIGRLSQSTVVPDGSYKQCLEDGLAYTGQVMPSIPLALDELPPQNVTALACNRGEARGDMIGVIENVTPSRFSCPDAQGRKYINIGKWQLTLQAVSTDVFGSRHYSKWLVITGHNSAI
jgi:hypothetical protein